MTWIAKKISDTRKIKGLTQEELVEQAKINLRNVQRIENAESEPRDKTLHLIGTVLEINTKDLIFKDRSTLKINVANRIVEVIFLSHLILS